MKRIIIECILIGTITLIIGNLLCKLLINFNSVEENQTLDNTLSKYTNSYIFHVILFLTGVLLHLMLEYIGLDNWYCEKICLKDKCEMVCTKEMTGGTLDSMLSKYDLEF